MTHATTRPFDPRALTEKERSFTRQLIERADIGKEEKKKYLTQLEAATVVRKCECGCASVDFAIAGVLSKSDVGLHPFADFVAIDRRFGAFVFSVDDTLAGVEIYSMADLNLPAEFPDPSEFVGWGETNQQPQQQRL